MNNQVQAQSPNEDKLTPIQKQVEIELTPDTFDIVIEYGEDSSKVYFFPELLTILHELRKQHGTIYIKVGFFEPGLRVIAPGDISSEHKTKRTQKLT